MKDKTIEVMKAFSICGIVVLHSIFINLGENNILSNVLRMTSIKTLLVLSGWVVYGKITQHGWLTEKIVRRIPLLLIFTFIYWVFYSTIAGIDGGELLNVGIGKWYIYTIATGFGWAVIWYVWVLILCYIALYLFEKYVANRMVKIPYLIKLTAISLIILLIPYDYFGIRQLQWYGMFMLAGYGLRYLVENYEKFKQYGKRLAYLSFILFPLSIALVGDDIDYIGKWINGGYADIINALRFGESKYLLAYLFVTITGVGFVYCISRYISNIKYLYKLLSFIGGSTIGILVFHKMILEMKLIDNYWACAIIALMLSLGIYQMLRRINVFNYLLFGGSDIPIKLSNKLEVWYGKTKAQKSW